MILKYGPIVIATIEPTKDNRWRVGYRLQYIIRYFDSLKEIEEEYPHCTIEEDIPQKPITDRDLQELYARALP